MSHFTVLTVVDQERLNESIDEIIDEHQPILESGDPAAMGEDDREFGEALLEVHENEDDDLREVLTEVGLHNAIANLLAPYQENNTGDCPEEYLEFYDQTEEIQSDADEVIEDGGYLGDTYPEYIGQTCGELYLDQLKNDSEARETAINSGFPEGELNEATEFDAVALLYLGYSAHDIDGERKYGYYENPNAKWDWYQVGGRWPGLLKVKEEGAGFRGRPSLMGPTPPDDLTAVDIARVGDLDIEYYREQTDEKMDEFWDKYQTYIKTGEDPDDHPLYGVYYELKQMGIEVTKIAGREKVEVSDNEYDRELTRKELETRYRWYFEWNTYAALDEEGWHSKGEMGWFGNSSDGTEDREEWSQGFFEKFILSQDDDTYVAVIDCHI